MRCWHAHVYPTPGIACWAARRRTRAAWAFCACECCLRQHAHERVRMQAEPTWKPARGRGARAGEGAGRGKAVCRQGQRPQPWLRALRTAAALQRLHAACVSRIVARRCSLFCSRNKFCDCVTPSARSRTAGPGTRARDPRPPHAPPEDERWRLFARHLRLPAVGARLAARGAGQQPRRLCAARLPPGFRRARPHTVPRAQAVHTLSRKNACPRVQTAQRSVARPRPVARLPPQRGGLWSRARGGSGERRQRAAVGRGRLRRAGAT